jgi:hypothetical protein
MVISKIIITTRSRVNNGVKKYFNARFLLYATYSLNKKKKKNRMKIDAKIYIKLTS